VVLCACLALHILQLGGTRRRRDEDLDSRNGTLLDGVPVGRGGLREGSIIRCGRSVLQFHFAEDHVPLPLSERTAFGSLVGASVAMRAVFAVLERAAQADATVLIEGETGTGKEGAAESLHTQSARSDRPFVVVDCSALPANLLESELFGHEKGAFTGATSRRIGAFEAANGGTLFLDEVGELPQDLQPKLLRVLEQRQIRRLGSNQHVAVDVRVVAATNRDLRAQVNEGNFRSDVYYRLAVVKVTLPPLRERVEDVPLLVDRFRARLSVDDVTAERLFTSEFLNRLGRSAWPGNVRELRNFLERCVVMQQSLPLQDLQAETQQPFRVDATLSYAEAKQAVVLEFERQYLAALLQRHGGNVSKAARAAEMDRPYLYKLLHRHGLRG
jgi:DNA-binding NtrC family response regulator